MDVQSYFNSLNSIFKKFFNVWKSTVLVEGREEPEADVLEVLILLIEQRENEGFVFWGRHQLILETIKVLANSTEPERRRFPDSYC